MSAFRRTFPGEHISIKLHFLETHLIDFARKWGTAGLFSEDGAESIHALINTFERRFASVKGQNKDRSIVSALEMQQDEGAEVKHSKRSSLCRWCFIVSPASVLLGVLSFFRAVSFAAV